MRVTLMSRPNSGKKKGFGFIELKDADTYNVSHEADESACVANTYNYGIS